MHGTFLCGAVKGGGGGGGAKIFVDRYVQGVAQKRACMQNLVMTSSSLKVLSYGTFYGRVLHRCVHGRQQKWRACRIFIPVCGIVISIP